MDTTNETKPIPGWRQADLRSLAIHEALVKKLRENPNLVDVAFANMDRWEKLGVAKDSWFSHEKWRRLLKGDFDVLLSKMVEDSEEMQQLRSCTPFAGILTNKERATVIEKTRF